MCSRKDEYFRRLLFRNSIKTINEGCDQDELLVPNCVCKHVVDDFSDYYGPVSESSGITEQKFFLKFRKNGVKTDSFVFRTRARDAKTGKLLQRYLTLSKIDKTKGFFKDERTGITGSKSISYKVEIYHKYKYSDQLYGDISNKPLSFTFEQLGSDALQLPKDIGSEFKVKIVAIGAPSVRRRIKANFQLKVEFRGYYPQEIDNPDLVSTSLEPGTSQVRKYSTN